VYSGRKNKLDEVKIVELKQKRQDGVLIKDLMKEFNISKASVYRYLI
jgi:transposase